MAATAWPPRGRRVTPAVPPHPALPPPPPLGAGGREQLPPGPVRRVRGAPPLPLHERPAGAPLRPTRPLRRHLARRARLRRAGTVGVRVCHASASMHSPLMHGHSRGARGRHATAPPCHSCEARGAASSRYIPLHAVTCRYVPLRAVTCRYVPLQLRGEERCRLRRFLGGAQDARRSRAALLEPAGGYGAPRPCIHGSWCMHSSLTAGGYGASIALSASVRIPRTCVHS